MTELTNAAKLLGARGGSAGKGTKKRISEDERRRRAERMRAIAVIRKANGVDKHN